MKNFKQLGIATAVAAVSASYVGLAQAQVTYPSTNLGDAAIVPYYTTQGDFTTGVHIINTSDMTQVVKLRLRRGSDSMDALDFNIIMSPKDEWVGNIDDSSGTITVTTDDTTCTAPLTNGVFPMPALYSAGAEEGYIEIIGMGSIDVVSPIGAASKHTSAGVPLNCVAAESNFFRVATLAPVPGSSANGIHSSILAHQTCTDDVSAALNGPADQGCVINATPVLPNTLGDTGNVLKVAYHIRDTASGLEMGGNAVHLADFATTAMLSNQESQIIGSPDLYGYFFPDLNGGSPVDPTTAPARMTTFEAVRTTLGATSIINDWSVAAARNVSTDWVVTLPGQYVMLDLGRYTTSLFDATKPCYTDLEIAAVNATEPTAQSCDWRDLPVTVSPIEIWDREEQTFINPQGGLVISPDVSGTPASTVFPNEVNVVEWTAGENAPVLDSVYNQSFDTSALGADFGWAELSVSATALKTQGIYNFTAGAPGVGNTAFTPIVETAIPVVGFVAWERSFPSDPSANYGRLVDHSYGS